MDKLKSRKLAVTVFILLATTVLAVLHVMSQDVASVFTGIGVAYNAAQGFIDHKAAQ